MTLLEKIENDIIAFLRKEEGKLPAELVAVAQKALGYTEQFEKLMASGEAIVIASIVPDGEPLREEIIAALAVLETVFTAIADADYKKGALATAGAKITAIQLPGLANNRYNLAFQTVYSDNKSATV